MESRGQEGCPEGGGLGQRMDGIQRGKGTRFAGEGEWRVGNGKVKPQAKESAHLKSKIQE